MPKRKVYVKFVKAKGWRCQFMTEDLKVVLPRQLNLATDEKLFEMAEKGGGKMNLEGRQAIEHGMKSGTGGIWLELTPDQFAKLLRP